MKAALFLCLFAACADVDVSTIESALTAENGQNLNGQNLNGQNLNGQNLNGQNLNGPDTGTFTIWTSTALKGGGTLSLQGSRLVKNSGDAQTLLQAELTARRANGTNVSMRIREVVAPAAGATNWKYALEYLETDGAWYPVCEDASGPRYAYALAGIWDHRQGVAGGGAHINDPTKFTFACDGIGAIGKCVNNGYEPWVSATLAAHHQACIRLLRGDFCGDGTPHTQNGNRVNLYDGIGVQADTEEWVFEAEWDENGARCFSPSNRSNAGVPCYNARVTLGCGLQQFPLGTLLVNETPTAGLTP